MTPLHWTYLIAAAWAGIIAFVWHSAPRSPAYLRKIIFAGGIATVCLMLIVGSAISRYFILAKKLEVTLPANESTPAANMPQPAEVQIEIHKNDSIGIDGVTVPMASLKIELSKRLARDGRLWVTVISEPDSKYGSAKDVLDVCSELKIENVTFTVPDEK